MLMSFTSMLPSGIGFGSNKEERERERQDKERERERTGQDETPRAGDNDGKLKDNAVDEQGVKKRRERNPNETFIVVRPPPSVSNHPLNLQLQLVPPQTKERSASGTSAASGLSSASNRASVDYSTQAPEQVGESLTRAPSTRSGRSDPSSFYASSSSASMSSIASSASTTSVGGRRMIVPLYNLSAHNVMTNTVLDAGTDAKVAKFHKRGMEILALAVLECIEVWPSYGRGGAAHVAFLNASNGGNPGASGGALDPDALLVTPTSSAISLSSAGSHPPYPHAQPSPTTPKMPTSLAYASRGNVTPTGSQSGAKRIFGKIFKRKDVQSPETSGSVVGSHVRLGSIEVSRFASPTSSESGHGASLSPADASKRRSLNPSSPTPSHFSVPPVSGSTQSGTGITQPLLQPAVIGIHPTLSAPINPPLGRPTRYVWIVRKWLKGADNGLLGGVMRGVSMVGAGIGGMTGIGERASTGNPNSSVADENRGEISAGVEVRFEWVRGQPKSQQKGGRRKLGQDALGKRVSASFSQEDGSVVQPRRSLAAESSEGRQEKSRSRVRRPATATAGPGMPRTSGESRRSIERDIRDSRTNSVTSASLSDEAQAMLRGMGPVDEDDGEESDPEDSETPWTCTLVVSSVPCNPASLWEYEHPDLHHPLGRRQSRRSHIDSTHEEPPVAGPNVPSGDAPIAPPPPQPKLRTDPPGTLLKLKVGALSPAPHHPKVVAQLKVPYPLPDIEVTHARVRRRVVTPEGVARPVSRSGTLEASGGRDERDRPKSRGGVFGSGMMGRGNGEGNGNRDGPEGLVLTAEEIKDVLSCTAFWVVVREGFGGVGKVNRKGDGWRIRG